jgi:D-sedoheptulose 7-phosphate isomerase
MIDDHRPGVLMSKPPPQRPTIEHYLATLSDVMSKAVATDGSGRAVKLTDAIDWAVARVTTIAAHANKAVFVGNGGSAGISSHLAIDYMKNGNVPALAFNDAASLTCLANDLGYENVFAKPIDVHGREGDLLVAISSSGRSASILNAVIAARQRAMAVLTLSGFDADNPLRRRGDMNFYVPSDLYGFVEIAHLALCHAILDLKMGWRGAEAERTVSSSA